MPDDLFLPPCLAPLDPSAAATPPGRQGILPSPSDPPIDKIYGIKTCDTMKKAFAWCDAHGVAYEFHDYKKLGVPRDRLVGWCQAAGWKTLLNTRGPTFRKLTPEQQDISTQS